MPFPTDAHDRRTPRLPRLIVRTERGLIRAGARSTRHAVISIVAPPAPERAEREPVNLAIVLDRSGSMGGQKFVLARRAVEQALAQLQPRDTFALVVYDNDVDLLAPCGPATAVARQAALSALDGIQPRGSTDLAAGYASSSRWPCSEPTPAAAAASPAPW